jgi:ribosomal protein S18 acetylase RimI-like enzyme
MSASLRIRRLTHADLGFADELRRLAGWNQTLDDWRRFLTLEPEGCFLAEGNGQPAGTATTTLYGPALAWVGMLLVHPEHRRRGIGRALLEHCLGHLKARGVQCVKLDATPQGEKLYRSFGFESEWTLARWLGAARGRHPQSPCTGLRSWRRADALAVGALDRAAFGAARCRLLEGLADRSSLAVVLEAEKGGVAGFGMLRPGSCAHYLGPVVADSEVAGLDLVRALLARSEGQPVFWDIPDPNTAAASWASQHGFALQRPLIRMRLGRSVAPGDPQRQFALSGPETG